MRIHSIIGVSAIFFLWATTCLGEELSNIDIVLIHQRHSKDTISITDIPAENDVIAGALLGAQDNNTTGKFTNQKFTIIDLPIDDASDPIQVSHDVTSKNVKFALIDAPKAWLLSFWDSIKGSDITIFNITATDDDLRNELCRKNIIHVAPSRSMLSDALAQYLVWKQWRHWVLIKGSHTEDELMATAYLKSARKYGAKIVGEKVFEDTGGARRSDSGSVQTQRQIPLFSQNLPNHDVIVTADETQVFAAYLPYQTYNADLVTGSSGLIPTSWDAAHEQWGAIQLQNRFVKSYNRSMNYRDANAWLAIRMIGEAASRAGSTSPETIQSFLLSQDFSIAAFKGSKLTIREWDHQVRQPILLSNSKVIVSVSPQEGFLHQVTELDTLGTDKPESKCHF